MIGTEAPAVSEFRTSELIATPRTDRPQRRAVKPDPAAGYVGLLLGAAAGAIGIKLPVLYGLSTLLVAAAGLVALTLVRGPGVSKLRITRFDLFFLLFLVASGAMETYNAYDLGHAPNYGTILNIMLGYIATWPARACVRSEADFIHFAKWFALPAVFVSLLAVAQLLRLPGVNELIVASVDATGLVRRLEIGRDIRATSTIGHWTGLGSYLSCIVALTCVELIYRRREGLGILRPMGVLAVLLLGQLATLTFASIALTGLVVAVAYLRFGAKLSVILAAALALLVGWQVFGQAITERLEQQARAEWASEQVVEWLPETLNFRLNIWLSETLPSARERPVTGWGYGVYNAIEDGWAKRPALLVWISPESEWLRTLISAGPILLVMQVALLVGAAVIIGRARRTPTLGPAMLPIIPLFYGLLVLSFIHNHFSGVGAPMVFWPMIGALLGVMRKEPRVVVARPQSAENMLAKVV